MCPDGYGIDWPVSVFEVFVYKQVECFLLQQVECESARGNRFSVGCTSNPTHEVVLSAPLTTEYVSVSPEYVFHLLRDDFGRNQLEAVP